MGEYLLLYLRKSRQDNENETVEEVLSRHERQLQEYAAKTFGAVIPEDRIYREIVSGETIDDRPEMKKVLKRIEDPACKGVLVIEPQRLTRGDLLDCGTIVHAFRYSKTLVMTPTKIYDIEDKYDRKFFEMELTRGNDYLEYTKEILTRGREASVHEGNYIASIAPYGYKKVKNGKEQILVIDPVEAEYVRMAYHWYVYDGLGAANIGHKLNDMGAHPRKSKCDCPHAKDKRIICKHIVALYFTIFPDEVEVFLKEVEEAQKKYEEYENNLYNKTINYIRAMSKSELEEAIIDILNVAPEWVYDRFVKNYIEL